MESFQHRAAKALLAEWLMKPPRGWPHMGDGRILVEYPICFEARPFRGFTGIDMLWDETGWNSTPFRIGATIPTYDEMKAEGCFPAVIADIVVTHKGEVRTLIEVVHKSDITVKKARKLQDLMREGMGFERVYTVSAQWIMSQVVVPAAFAGKHIL